jgi:predicted small integral membrane protein
MRWLSLIIAAVFCFVLGLAMWKAKRFNKASLEPIFMGIILFGIVALCQPLWQPLFQYGFPILLTGTAGYIFVTHLK